MLTLLEDMIRRHRGSGILVDANLLVVFLVGAACGRNAVSEFKRTRAYSPNDFDLLVGILSKFVRLIVTPSVLGEVSNLAGQLPSHRRSRVFTYLAHVLPLTGFSERLIDLSQVAASSCFVRLGFTDATIHELGVAGLPVLTDDLDLYVHLTSSGIEAFNFTHIRLLAG
jgi:hypothetical protein